MRILFAILLALTITACGSADKFLGYWKVKGDQFELIKIEKNGDSHMLTKYGISILSGSFVSEQRPVEIKDNTLTIPIMGSLGESGVYNESDKTLVLNGRKVFTKVDESEALKLIEAKKKIKPEIKIPKF